MDKPQGLSREDEIGALWSKRSKNGEEYMTGSVQADGGKVEKIVVFINRHKKSEKQPDYRILRARERSDAEAAPSRRYEGATVAPVGDDDAIPF